MDLVIDPRGVVRCLYTEIIDLSVLGRPNIRRASQVEPDANGQWWADMTPLGGGQLGPFERRSQALAAEIRWLETNWLGEGKEK